MAIFLQRPRMAGGMRKFSRVPFIRALVSFMRAPLSWPNHLPKAPSSNPIRVGVRFQHMNFGEGTQTFSPLQWLSLLSYSCTSVTHWNGELVKVMELSQLNTFEIGEKMKCFKTETTVINLLLSFKICQHQGGWHWILIHGKILTVRLSWVHSFSTLKS